LTITPAITGSGLVAGDTVTSRGITGITGCNVTATISTVVDTTHVELTGTTFGGSGFGGTACLDGGHWTSTNTSNWASSSTSTCGSAAPGVPSTTTPITFDANSGATGPSANIIVVDASVSGSTFASLAAGALNGKLDFSVNNPNLTLTSLALLGSGTREIDCGSGTFTLTNLSAATINVLDNSVVTNETLSCAGVTITLSATPTGNRLFSLGAAKVWGTINISDTGVTKYGVISNSTNPTITTLNISGSPFFSQVGTLTISNAFNWTGTTSAPVVWDSLVNQTAGITLTVNGAFNITNGIMIGVTKAGSSTITCTTCFDGGNNTGVTFTSPATIGGGGGSHIIGSGV
jgi:hypothetical protein